MKCDVTISKKMTLNTGNYSSVSPMCTLTLKDVDLERVAEVHEKLDIIADGLYHKQVISDIKTMGVIKSMGFDRYFESIAMEDMDEGIKKSIEEIME